MFGESELHVDGVGEELTVPSAQACRRVARCGPVSVAAGPTHRGSRGTTAGAMAASSSSAMHSNSAGSPLGKEKICVTCTTTMRDGSARPIRARPWSHCRCRLRRTALVAEPLLQLCHARATRWSVQPRSFVGPEKAKSLGEAVAEVVEVILRDVDTEGPDVNAVGHEYQTRRLLGIDHS